MVENVKKITLSGGKKTVAQKKKNQSENIFRLNFLKSFDLRVKSFRQRSERHTKK
jgi:hypothetical protein